MQQGFGVDASQVAAAVTGSSATVVAFASNDLTREVLGVPMVVVLAAFAGAMIALTFTPGSGIWRSLATVASGTVGGAYLAPLVLKLAAVLVPGSPVLEALDRPVAFLLGLGFQFAAPAFFAWIKRRGGV